MVNYCAEKWDLIEKSLCINTVDLEQFFLDSYL